MNRFATSRSLSFRIVAWLFLAALFCDGANLDDLLPGSVVLHDDADVMSCGVAGPGVGALSQAAGSPVRGASTLTLPVQFPSQMRGLVRVIVDQDSPSLTAMSCEGVPSWCAAANASAGVSADLRLPTSLLYLRNRSLII